MMKKYGDVAIPFKSGLFFLYDVFVKEVQESGCRNPF